MTKLILRILNKLALLDKLNLKGTITLNDKVFEIPILGELGYSNMFMIEPWMIKVLKIVLPISNGIFIDVGVNIGQTLLKLKSVSDQIEYIGFEPNPTCIFYVNKLVKVNNLKNVSLIPVGISTETELAKLVFYEDSDIDMSASIIKDFKPMLQIEKTEYVPIFNINTIKQNIRFNKISVVKIDVEGAELEVLLSLEGDIKVNTPIILIEILPVYNKENTDRLQRQNKIEKLFREWGYSINRVIKENDNLTGIEEIEEIGIHNDLNNCEYIMVHHTKQNEFRNAYQHQPA